MRNQNLFQALAARAHGETPPRVDVAGRVISILTVEEDRLDRITEKPLMWLAVLSSALAASVMVIAMISYFLQANPLAEISETISWVMQ